MPYQFATQDKDYSDFSSGRVLYHQPGAPAFPVRLASEIFQRAIHLLDLRRPIILYDPACGGAYHLTALGFLHGAAIQAILASDVDEHILELARRNLGLLDPRGLTLREAELSALFTSYGKPSHAEALRSAELLRRTRENLPSIKTRFFLANAFDPTALRHGLSGETPDLVISDVPYGQMSAWQAPEDHPIAAPPIWSVLDALLMVIHQTALVAIAADKRQKVTHEAYQRISQFQIGKRQVTFLRPL